MRDSTNPASRSTRRCLETDGCDSRSLRSISPTERSDESSRVRMARLWGSATTANEDSMIHVYAIGYIPVKPWPAGPPRLRDPPSGASLVWETHRAAHRSHKEHAT